MGEADSLMQPPRDILLATDLDGHTDRAMDRAGQLARQWHATLHVLHVRQPDIETAYWPATERTATDRAASIDLLDNQLRRDFRDWPDDVVVDVAEGNAADLILEAAQRDHCGLVILGCRRPSLAGISMHSTTAQLLRRSPQSLLMVKSRAHGAYEHVLVGTDFTAESRHGLEIAAAWFTPARFTLMHALDIPYRSLLLDAGRDEAFSRLEHDTMHDFVDAASLPEDVRAQMTTQLAHGPPEIMLRKHAAAHDVDLTVVGVLKRGLAFRLLVGGNAVRIVQSAAGDVLLVRAARAQ